ncbi:MAG TPA: choice-of-anchor Q domain-containing protein [Chthoniobacterales bacterium]|nr:choice-of-anchor Q domain-containing protein [Chthoniobacterales bacterium]
METFRKLLMSVFVLTAAITFQNADAKTITIHSTDDDGPGSLRQAIVSASNGDKINVVVNGTITLMSGELLVDKNLTVTGPGPHGIISGNNASRIFHITPGTIVTLTSLTITNGNAGIVVDVIPNGLGGAIYVDHASVTLNNCIVSNSVAQLGGGIFSNTINGGSSTLVVNNSTISNNIARSTTGFDGGFGGGIFSGGGFITGVGGSSTLTLNNSTVTGNTAEYLGGGILSDGFGGTAKLDINNCAISSNNAVNNFNRIPGGGGIYNNGDSGVATVNITNSRLIGNSAGPDVGGSGGAIYNDGTSTLTTGHANITIAGSTLDNNYGTNGGAAIFSGCSHGVTNVTLTNCSLAANSADGLGGALYFRNEEGLGTAKLTLNSCVFVKNFAVFGGGGIHIEDSVAELANTQLTGNAVSEGDGGAIQVDTGNIDILGLSHVTLRNCVVTNNTAGFVGGGITNSSLDFQIINSIIAGNSSEGGGGIVNENGQFNDSNLTILNSTVSGNTVTFPGGGGDGGGILNGGTNIGLGGSTATLRILNSTISGNTAANGGAVANLVFGVGDDRRAHGRVIVSNSTMSGNSALFAGGGIFTSGGEDVFGDAGVEIANTIINAGSAGENLVADDEGTVTSQGYNLSSDAAGGNNSKGPGGLLNGPGDIRNTNPMLGPLQNNGGPTMTHALLKNSPAIDHADPNFNPYLFNPPLLYDQRGPGFPRIVKGRLDIGAYEAGPH